MDREFRERMKRTTQAVAGTPRSQGRIQRMEPIGSPTLRASAGNASPLKSPTRRRHANMVYGDRMAGAEAATRFEVQSSDRASLEGVSLATDSRSYVEHHRRSRAVDGANELRTPTRVRVYNVVEQGDVVNNYNESIWSQAVQSEYMGVTSPAYTTATNGLLVSPQPRPVSSRLRSPPLAPLANTDVNSVFVYRSPKMNAISRMESPAKVTNGVAGPLSPQTQRILANAMKSPRKIMKIPHKILDAPDIRNDFYLNLLDWSNKNMLAVALSSTVYLWDATYMTSDTLCVLDNNLEIASVSWFESGERLAIGTEVGTVQIWDPEEKRRVRTLTACMAWNEYVLAAAGRDYKIRLHDTRIKNSIIRTIEGHRGEVCGLQWNPDRNYLASGGNDNTVYIWDRAASKPLVHFTEQHAAIKAIAWSPHQYGLIATGAGAKDRTIKFWNVNSPHRIESINVGSQVTNLWWSRTSDELVSTHGPQHNEVMVWQYPSMLRVASLTGHLQRVLFFAASPDNVTVVSGSADETLRFWRVFEKADVDAVRRRQIREAERWTPSKKSRIR